MAYIMPAIGPTSNVLYSDSAKTSYLIMIANLPIETSPKIVRF